MDFKNFFKIWFFSTFKSTSHEFSLYGYMHMRAYENVMKLFADDEYVTAKREVSEGQDYGLVPVYQLHYAIYYNSSSAAADTNVTLFQTSTIVPDDLKVSNTCARHYAETFLIRLFSLESWLNELCSAQRPFTPRVVSHTVVVVRVYGPLVSICRSLRCANS